MVKYIVDEKDLVLVADAIREASGEDDKLVFPLGFCETIGEMSDMEDGLVDGTLATYTNDRVTAVRNGAFYNYTALVSVNLPNVTSVGGAAFSSCKALTSVNLPNIAIVSANTFYNCSALPSVDFPNVTSVGQYAFCGCKKLTSIDLPNVTSVEGNAFYNCTALVSVNLPNVTSVGGAAFGSCKALTSLDLPNVTSVENSAFRGCEALAALILRRTDGIATLSNVNALGDTPIEYEEGYIYVPSALLDTYKTATNWSTYAAQFRALEDYTVDGTTAGALDETKI